MTDTIEADIARLAIGPKSTSEALGDRQAGNINLIESNVMDKIKSTRQQLDKLESVVSTRADQVREKISDLTEIANTVLNATDSLNHTIEGMLTNELKPL